jgi:hypothetical protein
MAKKRTKKDKVKAAERKVDFSVTTGQYSIQGASVGGASLPKLASRVDATASSRDIIEKLFGYSLQAVYLDLGKTLLVSTFIAILLGSITYFIRFQN